jgi:hypothetical protein
MLRDNQSESIKSMVESTKDGMFNTLTRRVKWRQRDSTKNLVSISIDLSTLSLNFLSTELLRCLEEPTWFSRDGETIRDNNNSGSMKRPRLSEITTGRTIALTFKAMVTATTSEQSLASTQDGGKCSD